MACDTRSVGSSHSNSNTKWAAVKSTARAKRRPISLRAVLRLSTQQSLLLAFSLFVVAFFFTDDFFAFGALALGCLGAT
jgi:hypothetical protein